jgi:hypothetical protein
VNEAVRLSIRLITLRLTAALGMLAIALMIATPSLEEAYRENCVLLKGPLLPLPIRSVTLHCSVLTIWIRRPELMRFVPFSYFWIC